MTDVIAAPVVATRAGSVRGSAAGGVTRFLGIPYAKPPFGELRFAAPEPAAAWDGVRDATAFGATAPKPDAEHSQSPLDFLVDDNIAGDECLNVNVWTPDPGATGLPVMVWIHGGAYLCGSNSQPLYDGTAFARDGVVLVSPNYRLGVEGFSLLPDAPPNRGLLDLTLALQWVRDNVASFGGDPDNVTIFGESAGAGLVLALLALDSGLFRRAGIASAAPTASLAPQDAALVTGEVAARLGVQPSAAGLSAIDPQDLANAAKLTFLDAGANPDPKRWGATTLTAGLPFIFCHDGEMLAQRPYDLVLAGAGSGVELMMGWTAEEMLAILGANPAPDDVLEARARGYLRLMGAADGAYEVYLQRCETPGAVMSAAMTDALFRIPALAIADRRSESPTYLYEFGWRSSIPGVGAAHALDLGFLFDNLGQSAIEGPDPSQVVADTVHRAWVDFARNGDPGWRRYESGSRPVMTFDETTRVVEDPRSAERLLW